MKSPLRVAFAGTPEFACCALAALHAAGFEVVLVLSQPDRPAGRGLRVLASPVKAFAVAHAIELVQPRSLRLDGKYPDDAEAAHEAIRHAAAEVVVVAAYGLLLPEWVLQMPRLGCLNIHASLLPRWRGAAPVQRAIEAGDSTTGITIMQMDVGLDTGDLRLVEKIEIDADATAASLLADLAPIGGRAIVDALSRLDGGGLPRWPQPFDGVTYAEKIRKAEADIDWHADAASIERRLRAFDPFPGASSTLNGALVKCWRGEVCAESGVHGAVLGEVTGIDERGIVVACGVGALRLLELQRAGGKRLAAAQFLQRDPLQVGMRFEPAGAAPA